MSGGRSLWDANEVVRLAVERLRVHAGETAGLYLATCEAGSDEPWRELYVFRNVLAHAVYGQVDPAHVWVAGTVDLPQLLEQVRAAFAGNPW
jgi:uncharacterized protein with HEPN domain